MYQPNFLITFVFHVGVSITSCITGKSDSVEDDDHLFMQLDAIYQVLAPHMYHFV